MSYETAIQQSNHNAALEREELNLVATLGLKPFIDGNMYCFLFGEDLASGVAGFGETVYKAMIDFNKNFHSATLPEKQ